ncbi:enterobactin exporter EntS [Clostridium tepidiprofundi DSM 19306]|uniref:Enterobactin exporter EntS n=1 Tax=Clostridium tepidiprofundi DSM 19306 TaxID=1121338 RepID=A0A151B073_9CLOT|nr:MFS transporter [Clostridium tepidiprofundi]KYH33298.1 enterobactin exporter EntS [Clostridium tepidiprofundi DSM 19306]
MIKLLKNRNVVILWISRALSRFGDALESLALMYLVYDLTGSGLAMGTVMLFSMIPNIVISPIAGVIVDRYSKKIIMFTAEMVRTVFILLIPILIYTGNIQLWHIYAISVIVSIAESFFEPCSGVVFTLIVSKDELPLLNSLSTTTNHIMRMVGYTAAGIIISFSNKGILFTIDSLTFLISAIAAIIMTIPKIESKKLEKISDMGKDFVDGLKYIFGNGIIPILFLAILIVNALGVPILQFLPITAEKVLKLDPTWAGYFLTISSIGNIVGGIIYPILVKKNMKLKTLYLYALNFMGLCILLVCYFPFKYIGIIMFFIVGVSCSLIGMWSFTEIQKICEKEYFGRVCSLTNIVLLASIPFASAVSGWLIDRVSLLNVFKATGILFIISAVVLYILTGKKIKVCTEAEAISDCSKG